MNADEIKYRLQEIDRKISWLYDEIDQLETEECELKDELENLK